MGDRIKAVCAGTLFDGLVECFVLADGRHVISQRGAVQALTGAGAKHGKIDRYLTRLPSRFEYLTVGPNIEFTPPDGGSATGRDAEWFVDVLQSYVDAFFAGELRADQAPLARNAAKVLRALSKVGIIALIDEATGYEAVKEGGALRQLFDRLFRRDRADWKQMFPPSLITELVKLHGHTWAGGSHPRFLGNVNERIYRMILSSPGYEELKKRNPSPSYGKNHHQHLTDEAQGFLREQLGIVEVIARQSQGKENFWSRMDRQYRNGWLQLDLDPEPES